MSQIDKLNFLVHIFWFIVLFSVFYFTMFCYFLPIIFQSLSMRRYYYAHLVRQGLNYASLLSYLNRKPTLKNLSNINDKILKGYSKFF